VLGWILNELSFALEKLSDSLPHSFADVKKGSGALIIHVGAGAGRNIESAEEWAGVDGGDVVDGFSDINVKLNRPPKP
jgi:hypothetical protein